ncbi:MAG: hypothetical protein A2V63_01880 [Candidatus Eisenbacteria bacterium RBG_19FT_COMBO_70_11]|nr:MAG: hypothetical protein A2V63_01880 [Candidatus Eisenbacteria bacterium RBG_19FT_COMBO_70_11]
MIASIQGHAAGSARRATGVCVISASHSVRADCHAIPASERREDSLRSPAARVQRAISTGERKPWCATAAQA